MPHPDYAHATALDFDHIPVVDISDRNTDEAFERIAQALVTHAQQVGFFYVSGHGIADSIIDHAFAAAQTFFTLPEPSKARIRVNQQQRGWMAQGMANLESAATFDAKEVFFWGWDVAADDPDVLNNTPMVAPNQWPDTVMPALRPAIQAYYLQAVELGRFLLSALAAGLGQPRDFFRAAYQKPLARGQLVYYPPHSETDTRAQRFGAAAHTDFGVLTVLLQDHHGGLQAQNRRGHWVKVPPIPGTLVCNIGELLQRWTNQRLRATVHRVINSSAEARYSIPVFCDPCSTAIIDPRDFDATLERVTGPPVTAGEYIAERNRKNFSQYAEQR